ncbi:MAG: hypothetical protein KKC76_08285 [Proteobacteria bacterium]|nr:hypothetical protein [Pseudomonadota bacterium]MBU4298071.1 hypothetical protein [Pseudomonadota bacterium]MCG2746307.1 hypothetical protein [Desulfobulbaceae bacterium]
MIRYLHGVVWIVFSTVMFFTSSHVAMADDQTITGGLYHDGGLVDSFVEPLPSFGSSTNASARTLDSVPTGSKSQIFRQRVQPAKPGTEMQSRNLAFARAAEAGAKLRELLRRMSAREGEDQVADRQSLQALLQEFEATHAEVREALNRIGDRVIELGLDQSVQERHLEAVRAFVEGSKELRAAIKDVIDDKPDALLQAHDVMQRLKFRDDPPLLNSGLPFQKYVLEAPRLTRQQADATLEAEALEAEAQADIRVNDLAITPPTADDLAETPDIKFTPEITAKATELGKSPLAIYEFVRNKVSFEAYLGSRKGAANTLEQLRGNDTDQASLLLALLRVSGIPSRYVRGTVEMAPEATMSWLGVDDAAKAASILTTAGLDGMAIVNGPDVVAIRSTHVWVEAYLPYSNYRGIPNDNTGRSWVTLDPSFKGNDINLGEDVLAPMGFDVESFITAYISSVSDPDPLEQLESDIQAYLDANDSGKTVTDIERKQRIAPQLLGFLPGSTPYSVRAISDRLAELEAAKRYKVRFHLYDDTTDFIDYTIDLPVLAGKRLTIEYVGATATDQDTIDSFGGIYETPPNLVDVKPVLELDGIAIATSSNSIGMGYTHSSDMQFIQPVGASNVQPFVRNEIIAGNGQAIGFDTFLDVHDSFLGGDTFPAEDFLEAILHTTATDYLSRVDRGMEKAERLMRVVTTQDVSEAIVENAISVSYSFGVPVTFEWTGLTVDADRRIIGTFDVDGDGSQDLPYMKLTGIHGSLMENRVFEEMFDQDAVSTIKIIQLASDAGIGICTIQTSVYGECPGITQPSYVISALNSALSQGHVITIPEDPITVSQWSGTGYIDLDPTTGAGGYIISGGISGAVQTDAGGATVETWSDNLGCEPNTGGTITIIQPADPAPASSVVYCADNTYIPIEIRYQYTCKNDGSSQDLTVTHQTSSTKEQLGGGEYELRVDAFGTTATRKITIVGVEKLTTASGIEVDDGDGDANTRRFIVAHDSAGAAVTVVATPKPVVAEADLPGCWSLTGGNGSGKLSRTVDRTSPVQKTLTATAGSSTKSTEIIVLGFTVESPSAAVCDGNAAPVSIKPLPAALPVSILSNVSGLTLSSSTDATSFGNPASTTTLTFDAIATPAYTTNVQNARLYANVATQCNSSSVYTIKGTGTVGGEAVKSTDTASSKLTVDMSCIFAANPHAGLDPPIFIGSPTVTVTNPSPGVFTATLAIGTFAESLVASTKALGGIPPASQYRPMIVAEENFHVTQWNQTGSAVLSTIYDATRVMTNATAMGPFTAGTSAAAQGLATTAFTSALSTELSTAATRFGPLTGTSLACQAEVEAKASAGATHFGKIQCTYPNCTP